ncbi:MAG: glycosyltransferase [Ilumatobacteraceae bacterium]
MAVPPARSLRVLVTSTPGAGHIEPLVPLATALQAAGHRVLWATAEQSCARLQAMGFDTVPAGMGIGERVAALAPHMPEIMALDPRARRSRLFTGFFADVAGPRMHADLLAVFDDFHPHVIIHEMSELAAAPMAAGRGLPHATVAFSGAVHDAVLSSVLHSMAAIWRAEGVPDAGLAELLGDLYLHPFPASFGPPPAHPNARLLQPGAAEPGEVPEWLRPLGRDRPLVYLTAGTEVATQTAPWLAAFEVLAALDVDAVATIGPLLDTAMLGAVPANVHVERFVPQALLLSRASVVASHGGAGSVLGAARHGVPQLLYPMAADQWDNADAVSRAGAGIVLELEHRDAADIAAALQRLLHEPALRAAASAVAAEIAAMPSATDHVAAIEALVG